MNIRGRRYRVIYDTEAIAHEEAALSIRHEFTRRIRIAAGAFHALRDTWRMLLPTAGPIAFSYWSHKVFRWVTPFAILVAALSSLALCARPWYAAVAVCGILLALAAYIGFRRESAGLPLGKFSVPYYFFSMNLALFLGFFRFLNGSQKAAWTRTPRGK